MQSVSVWCCTIKSIIYEASRSTKPIKFRRITETTILTSIQYLITDVGTHRPTTAGPVNTDMYVNIVYIVYNVNITWTNICLDFITCCQLYSHCLSFPCINIVFTMNHSTVVHDHGTFNKVCLCSSTLSTLRDHLCCSNRVMNSI